MDQIFILERSLWLLGGKRVGGMGWVRLDTRLQEKWLEQKISVPCPHPLPQPPGAPTGLSLCCQRWHLFARGPSLAPVLPLLCKLHSRSKVMTGWSQGINTSAFSPLGWDSSETWVYCGFPSLSHGVKSQLPKAVARVPCTLHWLPPLL